ncbi:LexA family protein [Sphingomonas sp. 1P08PE]|uniref:LexA family protein n=1 Tax=Sphingomonas sp. 1P08PE TaxID=554122 RepID=UPI0039A2E10F
MKPGLLGKTFLGHAGALEMRSDALDGACNHEAEINTSRCDLQAYNHIMMGKVRDIDRDMSRTPDERREILRTFMQEHGLKVARWAKDAGVSANSIYNFLNDQGSNSLSAITYGKLARAAKVPVWQLSGDEPESASPTALWVVGYVEAGAFRDAVEWDQSRWYAIDVPVQPRFRKNAKALEVRGPSMNLDYPPGSVVIWVDMLDARPPRDRDHVIVYAHSLDGEIEATVKELRIVDGKQWLWPRSTDPAHQSPIDVATPGDHVSWIEVKGLVVGDYRQRHI